VLGKRKKSAPEMPEPACRDLSRGRRLIYGPFEKKEEKHYQVGGRKTFIFETTFVRRDECRKSAVNRKGFRKKKQLRGQVSPAETKKENGASLKEREKERASGGKPFFQGVGFFAAGLRAGGGGPWGKATLHEQWREGGASNRFSCQENLKTDWEKSFPVSKVGGKNKGTKNVL